jgi:hypothetical protein
MQDGGPDDPGLALSDRGHGVLLVWCSDMQDGSPSMTRALPFLIVARALS